MCSLLVYSDEKAAEEKAVAMRREIKSLAETGIFGNFEGDEEEILKSVRVRVIRIEKGMKLPLMEEIE